VGQLDNVHVLEIPISGRLLTAIDAALWKLEQSDVILCDCFSREELVIYAIEFALQDLKVDVLYDSLLDGA
jgi:hypothetical protein